ncbi:hypothetical protein QGM61_05575 [Pseudohongiella sp. SYSU M77423]|uniref:hypothetical protein n=1 Tax=Pseudohongiella sp. SYSU M77423 TaxID=3042312 RepID=UPI002481482B|nr:hypothetical protein [Pseudohongiella sp. SYSU M77423]MDH7943281.1 hypothetical protein [Pseudohongiella sp. SYSU M77423]|tara:strand:+ start:272 stop:424 length:153 start_codon:yes stop_codon:yes gene_type:complete
MSDAFKKALQEKSAELAEERRKREQLEKANGKAPELPDIKLNWGNKPTKH